MGVKSLSHPWAAGREQLDLCLKMVPCGAIYAPSSSQYPAEARRKQKHRLAQLLPPPPPAALTPSEDASSVTCVPPNHL